MEQKVFKNGIIPEEVKEAFFKQFGGAPVNHDMIEDEVTNPKYLKLMKLAKIVMERDSVEDRYKFIDDFRADPKSTPGKVALMELLLIDEVGLDQLRYQDIPELVEAEVVSH